MDSALTAIGLPIALAFIMFGLGLGLTIADFRRVGAHPKAVVIALACQLVLLPAICFGLVVLFDLPPFLGIGMLLLAASPGGTTANLFSHLFRGDVALNISLTAINSVIAIGTLPLITNLAIDYFDKSETVSMPLEEVIKVFVLILVPTAIGMLVRARSESFAVRMDKPVRIASAIILAVLVLAILLGERERVGEYIADVGLVATLFCALSLVIGYVVPRAFGVVERQSIASSFEIGVHNGTLAIFVAENILEVNEIAVPAAVYSLLMFVLAALWGLFISRRVGSTRESVAA
ncbi:MAG: bile acid:sodium symporter family protein [Nocardioides sp.]|jgi:BASS family bile acid:Na+ symporter|uniref:bile acid:sodium symporter family protein n=1 Tax=Nocardioides sp. TaxID=35761 RepID=UPI002624AA51|nr:bile acid:sodium symporter family protein [Nocardioides sp.]MCW2835379.1 bile acid:sodium symporter family protein [Nocardioides sp.]